jgi:hypothetical protein
MQTQEEALTCCCIHLYSPLLYGTFLTFVNLPLRSSILTGVNIATSTTKGEGSSGNKLCMQQESFDKQLEYIHHDLEGNETMARASLCGEMILPKICLYVMLCWLAGGLYLLT